MLAEPRRKCILTPNPRGRLWADDKDKFGQKMLEKMGWSEGQGLGKDCSGIKEHVRVKYKNDSKGIGFKPKYDDQWIDGNEQFEKLLSDLAKHHQSAATTEVSSLIEANQKRRNKIRFDKFVKSKDLSSCSDQELASIFPRTKRRKRSADDQIEEEDFVKTIEGGLNVNEYFKMKMQNLNKKRKCATSSDEAASQNECLSDRNGKRVKKKKDLNQESVESVRDSQLSLRTSKKMKRKTS